MPGAELAVAILAGGLWFSDRGTRPMGRAGAFVAGADDLGAIWYNPAGVVDAGNSVLADFDWLRFDNEYTRELRIVDADGVVRYVRSPTVRGTAPVLPIPTIAMSLVLDDAKRWVIAGGFYAPQVALASYSELAGGERSPARYTLGSFDGSLLGVPGGWIGWRPVPSLRVGLGVQALVGVFQSTVTFSASPQDRLLGAPEQPEFDAASQLRVGPIFAPTGNAGIIWEPVTAVRLGVSAQAPTVVNAPATIKVRLPTSSVFDGATVTGDRAQMRFVLPAVIRLGVEARPTPELRVEASYVRELWSAHRTIDATPKNIAIEGIVGAPPRVSFPNIVIPRGFTDSNGFRVGGEYAVMVGGYRVDLRGGAAYETSAVPPEYLSLSSLDFDKVVLSIGGGLHVGEHWRFDGVWSHLFASGVRVDPDRAQIPRINPLNGNAPLEAVNGGTYQASADLIGVGLEYKY